MGNKAGKKKSEIVEGDATGSANTDVAAALTNGGSGNKTIGLSISCKQLKDTALISKMDPFLVVFTCKGESWIEIARTEFYEDSSFPSFDLILARFNVEENQRVKFVVYDAKGDFSVNKELKRRREVGSCETTVPALVSGQGYFESPLSAPGGGAGPVGMIYVCSEMMADTHPTDVVMKLRCEQVENIHTFSSTTSYIRVSRLHKSGHWMPIFNTTKEDGASPKFAENRISLALLGNSDLTRTLKFDLLGYHKGAEDAHLCEMMITIGQLAQLIADGKGALGIKLTAPLTPTKVISTTLHFDYLQAFRVPTFSEYLDGGAELCFSIAIDFTGSNGESSSMFAHHASDRLQKMKEAAELYCDAIHAVGGCMEAYDADGLFPAFGFQGSHVFALKADEADPRVSGTQGISAVFRDALRQRPLKGPTLFEPVIRKGMQLASVAGATGSKHYIVLIVLTDGKFTDKQKTIDAAKEAADLPLSILFVGVGSDPDGHDMAAIDDLIKACQAASSRNLMQFIALNSLDNLEPAAKSYVFARMMVKDIPTQLVTYYWGRNVYPTIEGVSYGQTSLLALHLPPPPDGVPNAGMAFLPPPTGP